MKTQVQTVRATKETGTLYVGPAGKRTGITIHTGMADVEVTFARGVLAGRRYRPVGFTVTAVGPLYCTGTIETRDQLVAITDTRVGTSPFARGWRQ